MVAVWNEVGTFINNSYNICRPSDSLSGHPLTDSATTTVTHCLRQEQSCGLGQLIKRLDYVDVFGYYTRMTNRKVSPFKQKTAICGCFLFVP